jgi:hypothetical protein
MMKPARFAPSPERFRIRRSQTYFQKGGGFNMQLPNSPYACDVCEKRRDSDVNHWWVLTLHYEGAEGLAELLIAPYTDEYAKRRNAAHACGQAHAQILVARFMAHGSFEKLPQEVENGSTT